MDAVFSLKSDLYLTPLKALIMAKRIESNMDGMGLVPENRPLAGSKPFLKVWSRYCLIYVFWLFIVGTAHCWVAPGDMDDSHSIELSDVILALRVLSGGAPLGIHSGSDSDGDGRIGTQDVVFILQVLAEQRQIPPEGIIDLPVDGLVIPVGGTVVFSGSGYDVDGDIPLGYHWEFGDGSGLFQETQAYPGARVYNSQGIFITSLTVSDSRGIEDPTPATLQIQVADELLDRTGWTVYGVDSEELSGEDGGADNLLDGDTETYWHTQWKTTDPPEPPHYVQIDMGAFFEVTGIRYLPRQDGGINGRITDYIFSVSDDGINWFVVSAGAFQNNGFEQEIRFDGVTARFLQLEALGEVNDQPYTTVAELNVLGAPFSGNRPPDGTIILPSADLTILAGDSVTFTGSGTDPDANLPLVFFWDFGDMSGISPSTSASPGEVVFDETGLFAVTLTVRDSLGRTDPSPASRIVRVLSPGVDQSIPQTGWNVIYVDSEEISEEDGRGVNAIDGNAGTLWHTEWSLAQPDTPHEIQIDLGSAYELSGFCYLPRQDASVNGTIRDYLLFVGRDGRDWGSPVASGSWPNDKDEKVILFETAFGQFVRLIAHSEVNNKEFTTAAELGVEGNCETPYVHLIEPYPGSVESSQNLKVRASVCLDPGLFPGWSVEFRLDSGMQRAVVATAPYQHVFDAVPFGEHSVEARILNAQGIHVLDENTAHTVNGVAVGDYFVAIGDSITAGVGDDIPGDDVSGDSRNLEGGFTPILSDLLTSKRSHPVFIAMEGIPGITSAGGLDRLPTVISKHPKAEYFLILFGTNDANQTPSVPPDDFKVNLQNMIDLIKLSGAEPILAKIPYSLKTTINPAIQLYNQKIEELVTENSISIAPPDFYLYFQENQNRFSDKFHPDGIGYQNMASLWSDVLP